MTLRLLNAHDVRQLLSMESCIDLMRKAMLLVAQGKTVQPIRSTLAHPNGKGLLSMMPGYTTDPEWLGIKVVSVFPGNFGTDRGSHQGLVLLFEPAHGSPVAILDGREITAIRTAAATAVATDVLARNDSSCLAIMGYGEQARAHLTSMLLVRRFRRVLIWGRDLEKARRFCQWVQTEFQTDIEVTDTASVAIDQADVICTATASRDPIIEGRWLRPGQHLNLVGSSIPTTCEVDSEVVTRSRFFVDFKESALELAGEFRNAKRAGLIDDRHIVGSIGEIIAGRVMGRSSNQDITLFKSLGMASEDLMAADFIFRESERLNSGTVVEW